MKRRFIARMMVLAVAVLLLPRAGFAAEVEAPDGSWSLTVEDGWIVSGTVKADTPVDVVIPDEVEGMRIETISNRAFYGCKSLRSVQLPKYLYAVRDNAFDGCTNLERVIASPEAASSPDGYQIYPYAFAGCTALQEAVFPENVFVMEDAFRGCTALERVVFPCFIDDIESGAFLDCPNLREVYIGGSIMGTVADGDRHGDEPAFPAGVTLYSDYTSGELTLQAEYRSRPRLLPCGMRFAQGETALDGLPQAAGDYRLYCRYGTKYGADFKELLPATAFVAVYQGDTLLKVQPYAVAADGWNSLMGAYPEIDVGEITLPVHWPAGADSARVLLWQGNALQPLTVEGWIQ